MKFERKDKLALRFMGSFEILKRMGKVAYRLVLLASMDQIYNVFHVSLLYKHINDPTHVLSKEELKLTNNLVYEKCLVQILD